jgi:aryl-alcohol dehydrogenase-like predicted oxidoreductase
VQATTLEEVGTTPLVEKQASFYRAVLWLITCCTCAVANGVQATPVEEQMEALSRAVEAGKVVHVGLSNETPWGLLKALAAGTT